MLARTGEQDDPDRRVGFEFSDGASN